MLLKKIFQKNEIYNNYNYLLDSDISDYFKADEYYSYYESLKTVNPRRNISEELIAHNMPFLFSLKSEDVRRKIDQVIKDSVINQKIDPDANITKIAKRINPKGFKLLKLNMEENLTLDNLKQCYKIACKKHHPDIGGKNENMQIINIAFGQFHNLIKTFQLADDIGKDEESVFDDFDELGNLIIKSIDDFRFIIADQLFSICIDIFCIDKAMEMYEYINEFLLTNNKYRTYFFDSNIENFERLAIRLFKSSKFDQANRILKLLGELCEKQIKRGLSKEYFTKFYKKCENKLKGKEAIRIIINHSVQANHAYREGIIDKKQYEKLVDKFKAKDEVKDDIQKKLNEYAQRVSFLEDLGIYKIPADKISRKLIPEPDYFQDRFILLTDDQKIEYINAFKFPIKLELVRKYKEIRKTSYLLSLIKNYEHFPYQKIIQECKLLAEVLNDKSFLLIIEAYNYLHSIDPGERKKKLKYLNEMDCDEPPSLGITLELNNNAINDIDNVFIKRIDVHADYLEFMTATLEQLKVYQKTGKEPFFNQSDWNRDIEAINNLEKSEIAEAYREKWLSGEKDPYEMIKVALPYVKANLELGKKLNPRHTAELQLGYKINVLTTNYAKIKDWKNVIKWIELFFNLPENYRKRSSEGEIEKLRKRLLRAKKQTEK